MTTQYKIINPLTDPLWNDLVLTHEDYSFFHSSHWAKVIVDTYGYTPLYFTALSNNRIDALIPVMEVDSYLTGKRGISLPFSDYCMPIIADYSKAMDLLDKILAHGASSGWKHFEIRGGCDFIKMQPSTFYNGHLLKLSQNEPAMLSQINASTRRNINKAVAARVEIRICADLNSVKEFYRLHCMTRKLHGLPPQPFSFFENLYRNVLFENQGIVILAVYRNLTIAGAIFLHLGNKALYKYGASDTKFNQVRANNLVMWEAIKWYSKNGYTTFCFGRTDIDNEGLRRFKSGWGAVETTLSYYKYDLIKKAYVTDKTGKGFVTNNLLKHLPIPALRIAGNVLYKHIA